MDEKKNNVADSHEEDLSAVENEPYIVNPGLYNEEIAAEIVEDPTTEIDRNDEDSQVTNNIYGWIAIGLSVLSFIIMPYIFAGAAILLGFFARSRERTGLGNTAIIIGIISIIARLFFVNIF